MFNLPRKSSRRSERLSTVSSSAGPEEKKYEVEVPKAPKILKSVIKQRGFYSDTICPENEDELLEMPSRGPQTEQHLVQVIAKDHVPHVKTFKVGHWNINEAVEDLTSMNAVPQLFDFPPHSFHPKVQIAFFTLPGQCPRKIQLERTKKTYSQYDLLELLKQRRIKTSLIMPKAIIDHRLPENAIQLNSDPVNPAPFRTYLPIELFDDTEYDCRIPEEWLELGEHEGVRKPVPGIALLQSNDNLKHLNPRDPSLKYKWFNVGVLDYDKEKNVYLVQKVDDRGRVRDLNDELVINGGILPDGTRLSLPNQYWIPRIRLMFKAEFPVVYADRVKNAFDLRAKTEALLRYNLYVDCMPMEGVGELDQASMKRMIDWAKGAPSLAKSKLSILEDYLQVLEKEVNIDFCRSMNKLIFDAAVSGDRENFAFVTLPDPPCEHIPEKGCIEVESHSFDEVFHQFALNSLLSREEVGLAISKVRAECNRVIVMNLFHVPMNKSTRIDEFDQIQSQATAQVALFLKDSFISTLRVAIKTSLRDITKGWFNVHQTNFEVYQISKMKKFIEMIKFMMQDALRYLVQDSLISFTQMIVDSCQSTLDLTEEEELTWSDNITVSPYKPKRTPLFLVDLLIDGTGVHYSTPLDSFSTSLISLFDKGITACQSIPQIEKHVMEDMFLVGQPLLEAVGEQEPMVIELRERIRLCVSNALKPMKAYSKEYEKYIELAALDINHYIRDLDQKNLSALEMKDEILVHLKAQKQIEDELPTFLVIGPFYVQVDGVKQNLSKKRKALSVAVLDLLARKLRHQAEEACEDFKAISRKLFDKPACIEEVEEQREWMKTIPERMAEHQDALDLATADYDIMEEFNYNLTTDDFNLKWTTVGWPHKIQQLIEQTLESLLEDEDRFRKLQLTDQTAFNERLDGITMLVAGLPAYTDITRAHEIANQVRRIHKDLKECQADAAKYNNRERIFEMPITNYEKVGRLMKDFEPFRNLWVTTSDWIRWYESWMSDPLVAIDAETVEKNVNESYKTIHKVVKHFSETPGVIDVANAVKLMVEEFRPHIPLIQGLRNPGMRQRHWEMLSEEIGIQIVLKSTLTFKKCLEMNLQDHIKIIAKIAETAGKEYGIEQLLEKMLGEWQTINLEIIPYKDSTSCYIMKIGEEVSQMLDDHIVLTQSMNFSPYKKAFEDRIMKWEQTLRITQDVLDEWVVVQRQWLYLEPIFSSEDINRQLPLEGKRYQTMERTWKKIMKNAKEYPQVIVFCPDTRLLENLRECNRLLEQVQKGLSEYLETKRNSFPRFYFLSDDELLEILSQTKDPTAVQPHLRKCFENIARITFREDLKITEMISGEGEVVPFKLSLYPDGNVEDWLLEVEKVMKESLRLILKDALEDYKKKKRTEWVLEWPGQLVIAGAQTYWTSEVTEYLAERKLNTYYDILLKQLDGLRGLVRSPLTRIGRQILSALIVIEVHARDVVGNMLQENVMNPNDFEWISQLRYYWKEDSLYTCAVNAEFSYGFEYLGNTGRLVITPLTDRCYLTLTGALHLRFGGAPAGPAGTGKTETTKDLAKAFAIQCVVFNCSDQLDFMAMGKFFKGLASAGAWACFDEFNRIDIEVLSVVAQQITTIQKAQQQRLERFMFEGVEITLKPSCAVFITMNPGYAGRTELPDNLKALFRPVAMMVPDYALIAEISLFSFGFSDAKVLAKKIVTTFKLSSEQLSSQDHYDFGMRAVKSVISAAGNLKRQNPDMNEELIALRAIRDVNVPKFLLDDLKLFNGIVSDLFPNIQDEPIDYGALLVALKSSCKEKNLKDVDGFIHKCIQLYETTVVRHGLMLVGPTGSGKTKCYEVLQSAQTKLKGQMSPSGDNFETTLTYVLNPKSITLGQLYGEFDLLTHEWTDGILPMLIRIGTSSNNLDKRWYMFDGPVDAVWIESMNTVLDDNKKLCLSSGEIIKMTEAMTMMFEVADLAVASPATVSRCGMVYLEPGILGLQPFVECYLKQLSDNIYPYYDKLLELFDAFLEPSLAFLRQNMKEIVPTMDSNLTFSLFHVLDCFFKPFQKDEKKFTDEQLAKIADLIEPWFIFSLVWTVGATCDNNGRVKFDGWLRDQMSARKMRLQFPKAGQVYDYCLDDAGISSTSKDDDEDEDAAKTRKIQWKNWMSNIAELTISSDAKFSDIIVPTLDTVRSAFILEQLLTNNHPVLCVGPTGTGKTLAIADKLTRNMPKDFIPEFITFSAKTSANQTQDLIDGKLDKRRKGVFGPSPGRYILFFIDDLNMPALETYGAQPPIELLRQWMDFEGWYDRKAIGEFRHLVDVNFVAAMGPPGGGRNPVTPRLTRHFNFLSFTELEDPSKSKIFGTILNSWLAPNPDLSVHSSVLVDVCISVYNTITTELLPTPSKSHYTFNLRDLSKIFQGLLMARASKLQDLAALLRLWYHESLRVFADRLVNDEDRSWFSSLLAQKMKSSFSMEYSAVVTTEPLLYADFMSRSGADNKDYVELTDHTKMQKALQEFLDDYNQVNTKQMNLVLFMDAVRHLCRIGRVIRQPLGNALLLGVGGSGRQSLTRLAAHIKLADNLDNNARKRINMSIKDTGMDPSFYIGNFYPVSKAEYDLFQIELSKNYSTTDWKDDLKKVMMKAGLEDSQTVFLFCDTQIKDESFLEDLNNILNAGDVPNIYPLEDQDTIFDAMKPIVLDLGQQPTKTNMFTVYTKRVRSNLHTVITMSPMGEIFRARLRQFPALVNCCTIDWFSAWPAEALRSVATRSLSELENLETSPQVFNGLVEMCEKIHSSVAQYSTKFLHELSRHNYVTPTSYLELLGLFNRLIVIKKQEIEGNRDRMKSGLDKLLTTSDEVAVLQIELAKMRPLLEVAVTEALETMKLIAQDTKIAEETKAVVQAQEEDAKAKAKETQLIADDAQRDLNEALPALDAALASLKSLNKNDITEVRAMQRPPEGVRIVIEAVCIMKSVKPKRITTDKGDKKDDYWDVGKGLLADPAKFLESLFKFDRDNISEATIKAIQPYIDSESFQPAAIAKVSSACTSICQWVRAMHKYHFVAKAVAPKREALRVAQEDLAVTQRILDAAKKRLNDVSQKLAALQAKYDESVRKKDELEAKTRECEAKLIRADKLIGGLADEKNRWIESVVRFDKVLSNLVGDALISAGFVAYLGPFTGEYRVSITEHWISSMDNMGVPHNEACSLLDTFGDPVKQRAWQIAGLPKDNRSVENGVIVDYTKRWPLFIDPQGQANKWIKNLEKDKNIDVVKLSDKDFLRSLENAVRFGKPCMLENIGEELDPALEPILLRQTYIQQGALVIKLGDNVIPYHEDFKFYITTKLPNPHYTPEISAKVTLVNFTLSPKGLQDQLLGIVVAMERPDLEEAKNQLIVSNARMKQELKEIEDKILYRLSSSEGNPIDDVDLIATLEASKIKSQEISSKVEIAETTEKDIDITRSLYIPVAVNTSILFFCMDDLANIDPMYQYSLEWFINIFLLGISNSEGADNITQRIENINDYFTYSLYINVCRSLFEKHKLTFAFLLAARILQEDGLIDMDEWRYLLAGGTSKGQELPNPAPQWISSRLWGDILTLTSLPAFADIASSFTSHQHEFKKIFDSSEPHRATLPDRWDKELTMFQKLLILRCLRPDKVTQAMQDFVVEYMGQQFVEPQTTDLSLVYADSSPTIPLIFVLSAGTDPAADLYKFAEEMKFSKKLTAISLGQGQGPRAEEMLQNAMDRGLWVFFQNCHLSPSWMPNLERLVEQINPDKVHRDFRLWLTSMPSPKFPVFILQNGSKMTIEPPKGIKATLLKCYAGFNDDYLNSCGEKTATFKHLLLSLCLFHSIILERRKFGALGFNIPYEFTDGDFRMCMSQLKMFLEEYENIPYKVLTYTAGHINYGGRVTDDWDRRCMMNILHDFYNSEVLSDTHTYSPSGIYKQLDVSTEHEGYVQYIRNLPLNDTPEIFGLHDNANITFAQNETYGMLDALLKLQPKTSAGAGKSREEIMTETAVEMLKNLPPVTPIDSLVEKFPVMYEQSMNTVLVQEVIRYNKLLKVLAGSLNDLLKALKGLVVMSDKLEDMANSLYNNQVPQMWAGKAYPSLKPLAAWLVDLLARLAFMKQWIDHGIPSVFWISGFFFPQAFLTGTLQNFARSQVISIDTISFDFKVLEEPHTSIHEAPTSGCYIRGLYLEGARWDPNTHELGESLPKELYTDMPVIWLIPKPDRKPPTTGIYECPVYKTLTRAGTLSTTGHSTNFVFTIEVPSTKQQRHWVKRGVALLCALNY